MKAGRLVLFSTLFLAVALGGGLAWRHFHKPKLPGLVQTVQVMDIQSTVAAIGHIGEDRRTVVAAISEGDIFKLKPEQWVNFTLVAVPDRRFAGRLQEVKAMPISAKPDAQAEPDKPAAPQPATVDPDDPTYGDPGVTTNATAQHAAKAPDPYERSKDGVFYNVIFGMLDAAGQFPTGMSVMVHVVLGEVKQVPGISVLALGKSLGDNLYEVEVVDARGRLTPRRIVTGLSDNLSIQVMSGLAPGEAVMIQNNGALFEPGYRRGLGQ